MHLIPSKIYITIGNTRTAKKYNIKLVVHFIYITIKHILIPQDRLLKVYPYVVAFSMYTNGKRLLDTKVSDNSIQVLHCLKFIGMVWIVAGYHVKMTILNPLSNTLGALDVRLCSS